MELSLSPHQHCDSKPPHYIMNNPNKFFHCGLCDTVNTRATTRTPGKAKCRNCTHEHTRHDLWGIHSDGCDKCVVYYYDFVRSCWNCGMVEDRGGISGRSKCWGCGYTLDSSWGHKWKLTLEWAPNSHGYPRSEYDFNLSNTIHRHFDWGMARRGFIVDMVVVNGIVPTYEEAEDYFRKFLIVDDPVGTEKHKKFWKMYVEEYWRKWKVESPQTHKKWVETISHERWLDRKLSHDKTES